MSPHLHNTIATPITGRKDFPRATGHGSKCIPCLLENNEQLPPNTLKLHQKTNLVKPYNSAILEAWKNSKIKKHIIYKISRRWKIEDRK